MSQRFHFYTLLVVFVICSLVPIFAQSQNSEPQGFVISPTIQELEAQPGKSYQLDYTIKNETDVDNLETIISVQTFKEGDVSGSSQVVPFDEDNDNSYWIDAANSVVLKTDQASNFSYQINVPDEAKPGAYFFAILFEPQYNANQTNNSNKLVLKTRIASLLFVNIGGDESKQPTIENFTLSPAWVDPMFDKIDINYSVLVKGFSFYRPVGNIYLVDANSDSVITLASLTSNNLILPGGKRNYSTCYSKNSNDKNCNTNNKGIDMPWVGQRIIQLRLDYTDGNGDPKSDIIEKSVFFFPYKGILALLLLFSVAGGSFVFIKRKNRSSKPTPKSSLTKSS